jgi:hypothetical protein
MKLLKRIGPHLFHIRKGLIIKLLYIAEEIGVVYMGKVGLLKNPEFFVTAVFMYWMTLAILINNLEI